MAPLFPLVGSSLPSVPCLLVSTYICRVNRMPRALDPAPCIASYPCALRNLRNKLCVVLEDRDSKERTYSVRRSQRLWRKQDWRMWEQLVWGSLGGQRCLQSRGDFCKNIRVWRALSHDHVVEWRGFLLCAISFPCIWVAGSQLELI